MTQSELSLELFGAFRAAAGSSVLAFRTDKVRGLLAYLAVEASRSHARTSLSTLLWPDMPDATALRNLRKSLHRLNEALEPPLGAAAGTVIHATRQTIRLDPGACTSDVGSFSELLESVAAHPHRHLHLCTVCLERLSRAASLYRGELLAGFGLPDAEPFEEWLLMKRERFQHDALHILHLLAGAYLEREQPELAYTYAMRQTEIDPGREGAHRQVMRALTLGGQRAEALAYYERARQMLLDTLGVEPAPETMALAEQLARADSAGAAPTGDLSFPRTTRPHSRLPAQLTPFIGRATELLRIVEHFHDPECRVVTIVGPGGMGKTRLAVRAAEQLASRARFADGVNFIPLAAVQAADELSAALLAGLGVEADQYLDARTQLLQYLAGKETLLVLDNVEQIPDGVDLMVDILVAAPRVRMLITSRVPLDLQAEQRVPLDGLDYPGQHDERASGPEASVSTSQISAAGSVQLFVAAARRVRPDFSLSPANEADVLDICRLVGGMPLALELAVPWIRVMDCAAIAAGIRRNLELLTTRARDIPDRQRSIESVFTQTWNLLTPGERAALAQLAVFRSPFDLEAASHVAGASVIELASLLDKGLLHRGADGRYGLHELLRQFATSAAKDLPELNVDTVRDRHSTHYLQLVEDATEALYGSDARSAVGAIGVQLDNLREAWRWAISRGLVRQLASSLEGMGRFLELTSGLETAETMLAEGIDAARRRVEDTAGSADRTLLLRLLIWQAHFHEICNRVNAALRVARSALDLAEQWEDFDAAAEARIVLGETLPHRGEHEGAVTQLGMARDYFRDHGHPRYLARALSRMGEVQWRAGLYPPATETLRAASVLQERLGDSWELARARRALAGVSFESGNLEEAERQAKSALRLYEGAGDRRTAASMRGNLALVYRHLGRFELALQLNLYDLETSRDLGDSHAVATSLGNRALIYLDSGAVAEARACLEEALHIEEHLGNAWDAARHRAGLARILHLQGLHDLAMAQFADALPILRAHDARYYKVVPLLDAAELYFDRNRLDEAATLAQEGGTLARELDLSDQYLRSALLQAAIMHERGEHDRAAALLNELLAQAEDAASRASIHYQFWRCRPDALHAEAALRLYRELSERTSQHVYRVRADELAAYLDRSSTAVAASPG